MMERLPLEEAVPERPVLHGQLRPLGREHPSQQFGHLMALRYVRTLNGNIS